MGLGARNPDRAEKRVIRNFIPEKGVPRGCIPDFHGHGCRHKHMTGSVVERAPAGENSKWFVNISAAQSTVPVIGSSTQSGATSVGERRTRPKAGGEGEQLLQRDRRPRIFRVLGQNGRMSAGDDSRLSSPLSTSRAW